MVVALIAAGCGGDGSPVEPPPVESAASLEVVAGADLRDTISARVRLPVVIEAQSASGAPVSGLTLHVSVHPDDMHRMLIRPSDAHPFTPAFTATTEIGRITVYAELGTRAGPARLIVNAPGVDADTVTLHVLPGAPVTAQLSPRDTVVLVNQRVRFRGPAVDRAGNFRDDPVTMRVTGAARVGGGSDPRELAVNGIGRSVVHLSSSVGGRTFTDSIVVMAVPRGKYAYVQDTLLVVSDLTGRDPVVWAGGAPAMPAWSSDGAWLLFVRDGSVWFTDEPGRAVRIDTRDLTDPQWPQFDPLKRSIILQARRPGEPPSIYRVTLEGAVEAMLSSRGHAGMPDVNWDTRRMTYISAGWPHVLIYNLDARTTGDYSTGGNGHPGTPIWVDDLRIAYVQSATGGPLRLLSLWDHGTRTLTDSHFVAGITLAGLDLIVGSDGTHLVMSEVPASDRAWLPATVLSHTRGRTPSHRPGS